MTTFNSFKKKSLFVVLGLLVSGSAAAGTGFDPENERFVERYMWTVRKNRLAYTYCKIDLKKGTVARASDFDAKPDFKKPSRRGTEIKTLLGEHEYALERLTELAPSLWRASSEDKGYASFDRKKTKLRAFTTYVNYKLRENDPFFDDIRTFWRVVPNASPVRNTTCMASEAIEIINHVCGGMSPDGEALAGHYYNPCE